MEKLEKSKSLQVKTADASADIGLINGYSQKELQPDDVFCFSVVLCDNDVDRDKECFTTDALKKLARLFLGKPAIFDHDRSAKNQMARLYRVATEETGEKNAFGQPLTRLVGSAYMLKNESTQPVIDAIEGGILKEVSISCAMGGVSCSCCGKPMKRNWATWKMVCEDGHEAGAKYDGKLCAAQLENPLDAYEFSFVAVPAQRRAGVTKAAQDVDGAIHLLMEADLASCSDRLKALLPRIHAALMEDRDRAERAKLLEENKKYL